MLVLTRKPREEIRIGNGITITILRVKGQSVRVGIDAPNDVRIVRGELSPEEVVEHGSAVQEPVSVEKTTAAPTDQRKTQTASLRNRCEKSTSHYTADATATCSSRLSSPRRSGSALQAIVARNRAANANVASPVPSSSNGPPR